jgi:hypothetical protein
MSRKQKLTIYKPGDKVICLRDCNPVQMGGFLIKKDSVWIAQEYTDSKIYRFGHIRVNNWWYHGYDFIYVDLKDLSKSKIEEALEIINV